MNGSHDFSADGKCFKCGMARSQNIGRRFIDDSGPCKPEAKPGEFPGRMLLGDAMRAIVDAKKATR